MYEKKNPIKTHWHFLPFHFVHRGAKHASVLLRANSRRRDTSQHVQNWFRTRQVSNATKRYRTHASEDINFVCFSPKCFLPSLHIHTCPGTMPTISLKREWEKNQSIFNKHQKKNFYFSLFLVFVLYWRRISDGILIKNWKCFFLYTEIHIWIFS